MEKVKTAGQNPLRRINPANEHKTWRSEQFPGGKAGALNPPKQYKPPAPSLATPQGAQGDKASWRTARIGRPGAESGIPTAKKQ